MFQCDFVFASLGRLTNSILILFLCWMQSFGQVALTDIFKEAVSTSQPDSVLIIEPSQTILMGEMDEMDPMFDNGLDYFLMNNVENLPVKDDRVLIEKAMNLHGVATGSMLYFFKNLHFKRTVSISIPNDDYDGLIAFDNCIFERGLSFKGDYNNGVFLKSSIYHSLNWQGGKGHEFAIDSCQFYFFREPEQVNESGGSQIFSIGDEFYRGKRDTLSKYGQQIIRKDMSLSFEEIDNIEIRRSQFLSDSLISVANIESDQCAHFTFESNTTDQLINLNNLKVNESFTVLDNEISKYISLGDTELPSSSHKVRTQWNQFAGNKLVLLENSFTGGLGSVLQAIYTGSSSAELQNNNLFIGLTRSYQMLLNIFKVNGDLESMNGCFVEMKDLQGQRLKSNYKIHGGFKNYFSWKINRLLKIYTNHGTDPALAIVFSLYIIFIFGVIYYFFPSDWDLADKSQLVHNFRDFIQKNDKGYFKPFLKMSSGLVISLFNAMALSVNAFTTLGFGNIPTNGAARYICIIEGFLGWFLLSIFIVALINQVSI